MDQSGHSGGQNGDQKGRLDHFWAILVQYTFRQYRSHSLTCPLKSAWHLNLVHCIRCQICKLQGKEGQGLVCSWHDGSQCQRSLQQRWQMWVDLQGLLWAAWTSIQISFEAGLGAYQGLAQKIKVPFSRIFCFFVAVLRVQGRFQNPRQTPVCTKLQLKRFPKYYARAPVRGWAINPPNLRIESLAAIFFENMFRAARLQNETKNGLKNA